MEKTVMRVHKSIFLFFIFCCISLLGCGKTQEPVTTSVISIDDYGDVHLDLKEVDLEYGDSVDISFSGGYGLRAVPYYPDFYGRIRTAILTDYFDTVSVAGIGYDFNDTAGIRSGEEVTISLEQKGRYKEEFEAYKVSNAKTRMEGQSDEAFRNAREITAGRIREKCLYRGASPFDERFGRVELMEQFMVDNHIQCVLDLADSWDKLTGYEGLPEHTASMISKGQVIACKLGVDHQDPEAMQALGQGLARMIEMDGPYLVHCNLGRDRTGVVSAVLEALCGATYQEIVEDYMLTYDLLHGIDMDPKSLQYQVFKQRIDDQMNAVFGIAIEELPDSDLESAAAYYLIRCGMTKEQVERLKERLTE